MLKKACRFDDEIVFYFDAHDNKYVAQGGSLAWRLNNPGLLRSHDPIVKKNIIIGMHSPYAIFPTSASGIQALHDWLRSKFSNLLAIAKHYYPDSPEIWLDRLCQMADLSLKSKLKDLSNNAFRRLVKTIQLLCEFSASNAGNLQILPKISARYYSRDRKVEYYLAGFEELLTKAEAILWVETHRLDAVVVHKSNGVVYLRSRPGHHLNQIRFSEEVYGEEIEFKDALRDVGKKVEGQRIWGYINGIWNDDDYALKSTQMISEIARGEQVWSLVNNTKSKLKDLIECGHQKLSLDTDIVKFAAKFMQLLLQFSYESSRKPDVIIFVHSQGAIIADLALDLLSQDERKKIRIFAFGGGSFIFPGKSHYESHNYISIGDLVPRIGSPKLALLAIRLHEEQKKNCSLEQVIDLLANEDADYYLDTTDPRILEVFCEKRRKFYRDEFKKIANITVLEQGNDAFLGTWEHSFRVPCYQSKVKEIVNRCCND
jgi:hypothetical protein